MKATQDCRRLWEVDALREGNLSSADRESHARHRATCAQCRLQFEQDERLVALGQELAMPKLDALRVRRVRSHVLGTAARRSVKSRLAISPKLSAFGMAMAMALFAVVGFSLQKAKAPPPTVSAPPSKVAEGPRTAFASTVEVHPRALWSRTRQGGLERVVLDDGSLRLTVGHQTSSERFIVAMPDGEIEVRGTQFDVEVREGRTRSVLVTEGFVALRLTGQPERVLLAGDRWEETTVVPPPGLAKSTSSSRPPGVRGADTTTGARVADGAYARAISLYDEHQYEQAARALHAFAQSHAGTPEAADAEFLEASSLAYAGRPDAAALVAERFLDRWPNAFHSRDAAVLVARAARDRRDCVKARAVLSPWAGQAASPDVVAALGTCAH